MKLPDLEEGTKNDEGKVQMDLLSPYFLLGISKVLTFGAEKYAPYNWAKGIRFSRVFGALQRHLWAYWAGEELDEETGLSHLWHAGCCLMFLTHYESHPFQYEEFNDIPDYSDASPGDPSEEQRGSCGQRGEDSEPTLSAFAVPSDVPSKFAFNRETPLHKALRRKG